MTPEQARALISGTSEEQRARLLKSMTSQELTQFYDATLEASQTIAGELALHKVKMGGILKQAHDNLTDKQYRAFLRSAKIKISEALELIRLHENFQK